METPRSPGEVASQAIEHPRLAALRGRATVARVSQTKPQRTMVAVVQYLTRSVWI